MQEPAQPDPAQYSRLASGQPLHTYTQHSLNAFYADNGRFVRSQDPVYGNSDPTSAHKPTLRPRQSPDLALPSIEGGFASPTNQHNPSHNHSQQHHSFAPFDPTYRAIPQNVVPFKVHHNSFEEPPPGKKRRVHDQDYSESHNNESTVLTPLGDRDSHDAMHQRPAEAAPYAYAQWPQLDSRIVPLPPKNTAGSQDIFRLMQNEDQLIHPLSRVQFQTSMSSAEARGRPQSLLHPHVDHVAYRRKSPTSFNASQISPSTREIHELRPTLPHASGDVGSSVRAFAKIQPVVERVQRFDDAGREIRNDLGNLAIGDRHRRHYEFDTAEDMMARRVIYVPSEAASTNIYEIQRPQDNIYSQRPRENVERAQNDMHSHSGSRQQQPNVYDHPYQPGEQQSGKGVQYIPVSVEQRTIDPFERREPRFEPNADTQQWFDIQQSPVGFSLLTQFCLGLMRQYLRINATDCPRTLDDWRMYDLCISIKRSIDASTGGLRKK